VRVDGPFEGSVLHTFELAEGAVATSGIGRRSWLDADGRPAHHLIDPATGAPAFTGIVQVTALAPTGVVAEALAEAAILAGPEGVGRWLPHGGLVVYHDGSRRTIPSKGFLGSSWLRPTVASRSASMLVRHAQPVTGADRCPAKSTHSRARIPPGLWPPGRHGAQPVHPRVTQGRWRARACKLGAGASAGSEPP